MKNTPVHKPKFQRIIGFSDRERQILEALMMYRSVHSARRPHATCLWCRLRRYFYGKMDKKKYHYNRYLGIVIPHKESTYVLIIDDERHLARVKAVLLKRIMTFAEMLAN